MPSRRRLQRMQINVLGCMVWGVGVLLVTGIVVNGQSPKTLQRAAPQTQVEEIYVVRFVVESRTAPTEFCTPARTRLVDADAETRYSIWSISINASDGRVLDTNIKPIGSGHNCTGPTTSAEIRKAYVELKIGSKAFVATGECRYKSHSPERGIRDFHCSLDLSAPDDRYVGGLLTTNSIRSLKEVGLETDPPGYTQSSIATIRIWKKRAQR